MKKFICMILLFTLSSSSVMAQFADQLDKKIPVMIDMRSDVQKSQFVFLSQDKKIFFFTSDSLNMQSYSIWYPFDGETIFIQSVVGILGYIVSVGIFAILTVGSCHGGQCSYIVFLGLPISGVFGSGISVYLSGDGQGGNGSFGMTSAGSIIGAATFFGLMSLADPHFDLGNIGYLLLLPILSVGGAIVGYHLSASTVITTQQTSLIQFDKNHFAINLPSMIINRYEYPTTSYGISANVLSINF